MTARLSPLVFAERCLAAIAFPISIAFLVWRFALGGDVPDWLVAACAFSIGRLLAKWAR